MRTPPRDLSLTVYAETPNQSHFTSCSLFLSIYYTLLIMASFSRYCRQCRTHIPSLASRVSGSFLYTCCKKRNYIPLANRTHDQCSTYKYIRLVYDFPLDWSNYRPASCATCLARLYDSYREQKGEPILEEGQVHRLTRAKQIIEKALQARIQGEKRKKQ
jgi:hypothetical protein